MRITLKLLPPYRKAGDAGEYSLTLPEDVVSLKELVSYLSREKADILAFELVDRQGVLTAEFLVNGKHEPVEHTLNDGDAISVIPYICGG
ncbi:MAG: MoaD/ThiS family protein [Dethiobacter sp.]|nr:MoaD/ThiS family protein [Dethiobacter sp.]